MRTSITAILAAAALLLAACGQAEIPEIVGDDLSFARGALASAGLDYDTVEVDVDDPDQDGMIQDAYYDADSRVIVEVGVLPRVTITGEFVLTGDPRLTDYSSVAEGDACFGSDGYADFGSGMNVVISDGSGNTVGTTSTGPATLTDYHPQVDALYCHTAFETQVDIVDFYEIEVGRRGGLSFSYDDLRDQDFHVSFSLG